MSRYFDQAAAATGTGSANAKVVTAPTSTSTPTPDSQTTLFVSRLPYTATSEDLSSFFSAIGPIRRAFIVTDQTTKKSKGVGYVSFSTNHDANEALQILQGRTLDESKVKGASKRKIKLQWADIKPSMKERGEKRKGIAEIAIERKQRQDEIEMEKQKEKEKHDHDDDGYQSLKVDQEVQGNDQEPIKKKSKLADGEAAGLHPSRQTMLSKPSSSHPSDPTLAVRTVLLTGLSSCKPKADSKTLYKKARKFGPVEEIIYPITLPDSNGNLDQSNNDSDAAHVVFKTPNHAMDSIPKFHNHIFKGALLSAVLKKKADGAKKLEERMRPETKEKRERIRKAAEEEMKLNPAGKGKSLDEIKNQPLPTEVTRQSRLIVRNLPFDVTAADLRAVFLPFGPVYAIDIPKKENEGSESKQDEEAMEIDGFKVEQETEISPDKERKEGDSDEDSDSASDSEASSTSPSSSTSSSSSSTSEQGGEEETQPPKANSKSTIKSKGTGRGFAFVWFISLSSATAALEALNGRLLGRGAAEAALAKSVRGKKSREEAKRKLEEVKNNALEWRKIAVDWAVGKKKWQELEKERESKGGETENEDEEDHDDEEDPNDGEKAKDDDDDADDSDLDPLEIDESKDQDLDEEDQEKDQEEKPSRPPPPPEGTTLFIRNLPFTATDSDLHQLFRAFGPLRYARVTMEKAVSGGSSSSVPRSRGTGFVCFWEKDHADQVLERAERIAAASGVGHSFNATGSNSIGSSTPSSNPFSLNSSSTASGNGGFLPGVSSVLTADTSAPLTSSLTLQGRLLSVTPAVERSTANQITQAAKSARDKSDKRNTYLMREGVPLPNVSKEILGRNVANLNAKEKEKRLISFDQRRSQISKNPSLFVSKTRLSLRQLPLYCTDRTLKRLALHARREFKSEVKNGLREDLSSEELSDETLSPAVQLELKGEKNPRNKGGRPTAVLQSKVVRQLDRIDSTTGLARSRGYGFIETRSHKDALMILRWANANPKAGEMMKLWASEELKEMVVRVNKELEGLIGNEKAEKLARLKRLEQRREELLKGSNPHDVADPSKGGKKGKGKKVEDKDAEEENAGDQDQDQEGGGKDVRGGSLVVEFSIENKNVTRKRDERGAAMREGAKNRKLRDEERPYLPASKSRTDSSSSFKGRDSKGENHREDHSKPSKRPNWNQSTRSQSSSKQTQEEKSRKKAGDKVERDGNDKIGNKVGGAIGRKRKEKKEKRKGGKK